MSWSQAVHLGSAFLCLAEVPQTASPHFSAQGLPFTSTCSTMSWGLGQVPGVCKGAKMSAQLG